MQRTLVLGLSLSALLVGCAADPVSTGIALDDEEVDILCACPTLAGFPTETECRAAGELFVLTDAEEACVRRVYSGHTAELDVIFNCENDASRDYNTCIRARIAGCPVTADIDPCIATLGVARAACASPSVQTAAELDACFL